jgi:hypothetical protein
MAYVTHQPPYRPLAQRPEWGRNAKAKHGTGIDGQWLVSFAFGAIVMLSALVFLVPMAIWS